MKFLKNLGIALVGILPFAVIIGIIVLWRNWNDGVFIGTFFEEFIPAFLIGLGVGLAVWLVLGSSKTFSLGTCSIFAAIALVITVAYKLLHFNQTVGVILLCIIFGVLIIKSWFVK